MIDVSIVMPCHNRRDALALTLAEMSRQSYPAEQFEVIVVDQASTDGVAGLVRSLEVPYTLRLLPQDGKYGISVARNAGIDNARAALVILLDADLVPDPGLVAAHVTLHAAHDRALGCGQVLPYAPAYTSFIDRAARPEAGLDRGDREGPLPFYEAFGGHLSLTRTVFREVGPFDPGLRGYEDIDFAYRAHRLGITVFNCPAAIGYHNHPRTLRERCAQARTYERMVPALLACYPELRGQLPFARDFEALDWRRDGAGNLYRKLRIRLLATALVQRGFFEMLSVLDRYQSAPRLAKILYWRLIAGSHYTGYREGCAAAREQVQALSAARTI